MHAHLKILISLCERADEVVAEQIYQLKVIDFLYKEFNLEYFIWLSESKEKHVLQVSYIYELKYICMMICINHSFITNAVKIFQFFCELQVNL